MSDEEQLYIEVRTVIEKHRATPAISPAWIATQVMCAIHFKPELHRLGYVGCHLQIRQMTRQELRRRLDPIEAIEASVRGEDDLFPETLQERYPKKTHPHEEPVYVLRDEMSDEDVAFNVARMRRGGRALLKHADALEAWDENRPRRAA